MEKIHLIGLALKHKTSNANGQSAIDCGNLWEEFLNGQYATRVPSKLSNDIFAVYHEYEGDHTRPFSYFIGCKVQPGTRAPADMASLILPDGTYTRIVAKGKMPDCIAKAWTEIWASPYDRAYTADFEVYGERSRDWNNSEVDIFLATK